MPRSLSPSSASFRNRTSSTRRNQRFSRLLVEVLEDRTLPSADIYNFFGPWFGQVRIGVSDYGTLQATPTVTTSVPLFLSLNSVPLNSSILALRYNAMGGNPQSEGIAGGTPREGWAVGDTLSGNWGGAVGNTTSNLTATSINQPNGFSANTTATAGGTFKVVQDFHPASNNNAYEDTVTITNTSAALVNARFLRSIHWYIEPVFANENVTIQGSAQPGVWAFQNTGALSGSNINPISNPLVGSGGGTDGTVFGDGGMTLILSLGSLAPGASISFNTYYGASGNQTVAQAAIGALGMTGYSLASPNIFGTAAFFYGINFPVTPPVTISQSGSSTNVTEGGATDTYTVVFSSQPTANVTINITPDSHVTVSPTGLTFTTANWNIPQTVTVTAVDDSIAQGPHTGNITHTATSTDSNFNGLTLTTITANITDNDVAGVTIAQSAGSTNVAEGGSTDTYTAVLTSQPAADVTVTMNPGTQVTVAPGTLTFTSANWNIPQTVTVIAVDDNVAQGPHTGTITHSAVSGDAAYNGIAIASITANIADNDVPPGITIAPTALTVVEGGPSRSYSVVLKTRPSADVTLTLSSGPEVTVFPSSLTFTDTNWYIPQAVNVQSATNDNVYTGTRADTITHTTTSADPAYNGIGATSVAVQIIDNDGFIVNGTPGNDTILVAPSADLSQVVVTVNGKATAVPGATGQLILNAGDGSDKVQINNPLLPVFVAAGTGTDTITVNGQTAASNTFVLGTSTLDVNGSTIFLDGVEKLAVNGGSQNDSFTVENNPLSSANLNAVTLGGGPGSNRLFGPDLASVWAIIGSNAGTLNGVAFTGMQNLNGGAASDTFALNLGKTVLGAIDGGGGSDVLDYTRFTTPVTVNLQTGSAPGAAGGILNIEAVVGGKGTSDKLIGPASSSLWNITGKNSGAVGGVSFQGFEYLVGGPGDDAFKFADGAAITGKIDGGAGVNDLLDYSSYSTPVSLNLQSKKATGITGGFLGIEGATGGSSSANALTAANSANSWNLTASNAGTIQSGSTVFTFSNMANLTGGSGSDAFGVTGSWTGKLNGGMGIDSLTGDDNNHSWNITGPNAGYLEGRYFANIENLTGGAGADAFAFNQGQRITGKIDGGAGSDVLDLSAFITAVNVNLQTGKATGVGSFANLEQFTAGASGNDVLTGANLSSAWDLTGTNAGTITNAAGSFDFSGFENLIGGYLDDALNKHGLLLTGRSSRFENINP